MNTNKYILLSLLTIVVAFTSCKKDYDSPPIQSLPTGNIISIDSLRNMYVGTDSIIDMDLSIFGIVTADELSGNIYKMLFIQDETNAIKLELTSSSSNTFFIGDKVRVSLKGARLYAYKNMIAITDLDPDKKIIKQTTGEAFVPELVSIDSIKNLNGVYSKYQARLVRIDAVEFLCSDVFSCPGVPSTWADAINQADENRTIEDTLGNSLLVRSSGFSSFANQALPTGKGSIIGIVSQYNGDMQLTIRNPAEAKMNEIRYNQCVYLQKDFNDENLTSGCWTQQNVVGNIDWYVDDIGSNGSPYAVIKNYNGSSNIPCETWLISPNLDLTTLVNPIMSLRSDMNYSGPALEAYITTNYTGDVTTTTWSALPINLDNTFGWGFVSSGDLSLSSYVNQNVTIAFKYKGSSSDGSTWELDDIIVQDN
mgnify:CR=1 FL=1|tara:strand:- start:13052 stop:14320 length:1269 start_codon:yes stop_codon:yes gene_type:complete